MKLPIAVRHTKCLTRFRGHDMPQCSAVAVGRKTSNSICVSVFGLPCDRFWKIAAGGRAGQGKNEVGIVGNRCR